MSLNAGTSPATGSGKEQPLAADQLAANGANKLDATKATGQVSTPISIVPSSSRPGRPSFIRKWS